MIDDFIKPVNPLPGTSGPEGESDVLLEEKTEKPANEKLSQTPRAMLFQHPPEIESEKQEQKNEPQIPTDNTNKNFKGQQKHEHVLCFSRKHWIVLFPHIIGFMLIISGLIAFTTLGLRQNLETFISPIAYKIVAFGALVVLTYYFHRFFVRLFNYYLQTIIVTNFRVVCLEMTLYFNNVRDSIDLHEIQNVIIQQEGILKTLLNFGEITVTMSSSSNATKVLHYVPNPEYYFRKINKSKREYISARRQVKVNELTDGLAKAKAS